MRKYILLFSVLLFSTKCFCQKTVFIEKYLLPADTDKAGQLIIEMPFGRYDIYKISGDTAGLKKTGDIFIDVICTDYPVNASLQVLNKNRVASFLERFPFIEADQLAQVNFFQQTDGALRENAMNMFHGLIVRYRPKQSIETMIDEVAKLEELLNTAEPIAAAKPAATAKKNEIAISDIEKLYKNRPRKYVNGDLYLQVGRTGIVDADYDITKKTALDSFVTVTPKDALKDGLIDKSEYKEYKKASLIRIYYPKWHKLDTVATPMPTSRGDSLMVKQTKKNPDSTIFKIFSRAKWKETVIVGDVTGSMYPYNAQLLLWIKVNSLDSLTRKFVFFNDGDSLPDSKKKLGKTGGIYFKTCNDFEDVKALLKSTMLKGGGGDYPENNIEALLKAEKVYPENQFQVMIADNWAPIKDKVLWKQLTKPVRVVLCGATEFNVNIDFLNLARQTKGSVHLMEKDLYDLATLHEGEFLQVGKNSFVVKNGVFVEASEGGNK